MALPVRSSPTSNLVPTTSVSKNSHTTIPTPRKDVDMADLSDSSPLSSLPGSLSSTPPSAWFEKRTSRSVDNARDNLSQLAVNRDHDSSPAHDVDEEISASSVDIKPSTPAALLTHVASSTPPAAIPPSSSPPASFAPANALSAPIFLNALDAVPAQPSSPPSASSTKSKKRAHAEIDQHNSPSLSPTQATLPEPIPTPAAKKPKTKKVKPTPAPAPASTRPSRSRKAPERFEHLPQPTKRTSAPRNPAAGSKVFDPTYITTNAKSRLVKTDLYHLLLADAAWTCLTVAEKHELIDLLPPSFENERLAKGIAEGTVADTVRPKEFGSNFNLFRTDVAKFKEELGNGQLGRGWMNEARVSVKERAEGRFDAWKVDEAESWWGQKGGSE